MLAIFFFFFLRVHLELCSQQFYASALQPLHPSHLIVTSAPLGPPSRPHFTAFSEGCRVRGDDSNAPSVIFGGVLEKGTYPMATRLLRGRMIGEIVMYLAHHKVLWAVPPPVDPAKQLLPCPTGVPCPSPSSALDTAHSSYITRSVACQLHAHLFSCPTYPMDLTPGDMWTAPLQVAQYLAGFPQFSDLPSLWADFDSFPS